MADNIAYAKFRKTLLIRSGFEMFAIRTMCRASKGFKI